MQTEYVVMRNFHMGEITQNLSAGERLIFNGTEMTRIKDGQKYTVNGLSMLAVAKLIVEDDGTRDFKEASQVATTPKQPTLPVNIQNDDERIVSKIVLPEKINGRTRQSTEEVAKTTAETAPRAIISEDQRVVGRADVRSIPLAKTSSTSEAKAIQKEQDQEAVVVSNAGSKMRNAVAEAMRAEGFGPQVTGGGLEIISDQSEGVIVAKIESLDDRKARLKNEAVEERKAFREAALAAESVSDSEKEREQAALAEDTRIALAKRNSASSKARTASVTKEDAGPELNEFGFPVDFPHNDHWRKRLDWCKANDDDRILNVVYAKSTESFQTQLVKAFPDIKFA